MNELAGQRVLMLLENSPFSTDGRVRREAQALAAAGCRVTVICRRGPGERRREQFGPIVAYQYAAPPAVDGFLGYVLEYAYALAVTSLLTIWVGLRTGFDVVHAHNPPDLFVLIGACCRLFGKKFVFDHHDLAPEMYRARFDGRGSALVYRTLAFFERLSCRWANHVLAANESYKCVEIARAGISPDRISVVRNGPEPCHLQEVQPAVGLRDEGQTLIGFVGEMGPQDGVDYLLRALVQLSRDCHRDDWRCILVGEGDCVESLKVQAENLGIGDRVQFTGWLDYRLVPSYISAMDVCVAPDPSNGYSDHSTIIKLMEYMAQAKPMVAFDLPEHRVTAGAAALYARVNDESDFARQLARLIDDCELRRELGETGRTRVVQRLAWEHQKPALLRAYRLVTARRNAVRNAGDKRALDERPSQHARVGDVADARLRSDAH